MSRQEFLDALYAALAGEVSEEKRQSDLRYYRDYIAEELSKGRTEEDVLAELGDPRLIARTIVDAQAASEEQYGYHYSDGNGAAYAYREAAEESPVYDTIGGNDIYGHGSAEQSYEQYEGGDIRGKIVSLTGWKATLIIIAVVVLILVLLSFVFTAVLRILLSPVFWIILIGFSIFKGFSDRNGWL